MSKFSNKPNLRVSKKKTKKENPTDTNDKISISNRLLGSASEVVFCFDTTGSMGPCIKNVRDHIKKTCEELFNEMPGLKIGMIAHGDYCDGPKYIDTLKLTNNQENIFSFIRNTPNTGGGDLPECYEAAANTAKDMGWDKNKVGKVLIMIGDDEPHGISYHLNKKKLDWRKELNDLREMGINVYPLQCLYQPHRDGPNNFWKAVSEIFSTPLMKLQDMSNSTGILKNYVHMSAGKDHYSEYAVKTCSLRGVSEEVTNSASFLISESSKYTPLDSTKK